MTTPFNDDIQEIMPDGTRIPVAHDETIDESRVTTVPTQRKVPSPSVTMFDPYADDLGYEDEERPSRWRNPRIWIAAGLLVVIIAGVVLFATRPTKQPLVFTSGQTTEGNLTLSASATGPISAGTYNLSFAANALVTEIEVHVGQQVTSGQALAKEDPTSLQDALTTAQRQLSAAQSSYNSALVGLQDAQSSQSASDASAVDAYNAIATPAAGKPTPTPQQLQTAQDQLTQAEVQAQNQVNQAQGQVNSASSQVSSSQSSVTTAQHNLAGATLSAPVSGDIASINGEVGEMSNAGSSTSSGSGSGSGGSSAFITLVNLSAMQIVAQVNEADIGNVNVGWPATFTVQAFPLDTFTGSVAAISPIGQTTSNVVTYPVTIAIDAKSASQARLFPGMTASVTITTQEAIDAILVPNTAINYARTAIRNGLITAASAQSTLVAAQQMIVNDGSLSGGKAGYVAELKNGKLTLVPIVTSLADTTNTVVMAGLQSGDTVVVGDNQQTTTVATPATGGNNIFGGGRGGRGGGGTGGGGGGGG